MKTLTALFILSFILLSCKPNPEQQNKPAQEHIFVNYEEPAQFPGGTAECFKFIEENLKYPTEAVAKKIEGRVLVQFIIDKDGSVTEAKVFRGIHPLLDQEAIRVVSSMPKWIPGKSKSKVIRSRFTLPVTFSLKDKK